MHNIVALDNSVVHIEFIVDSISEPIFVASNFEIKNVDMMADNNRTLKEWATPDVVYQPWCIQYPETEVSYELNSGLTHLMPRFQGLVGEDPHKHLKEFHVVCSTMQPRQPFRPQQ